MTNPIKIGDLVTRFGRTEEVVYVKATGSNGRYYSSGQMYGVVTTSHYQGLALQTIYASDVGTSLVPESFDVERTTVQNAVDKMGTSKFGSLSDMAEAVWECSLGDSGVDYAKTRYVQKFLERHSSSLSTDTFDVPTHTIMSVYSPFASDVKAGNIALTRNLKDLHAGRQTSMKPGRAFRYMFPALDDNDISLLAEAWIELTAPRVLTLHVGKSSKDFARSFDFERADYRNPRTTYDRKSISTSCMQHVHRHFYDGVIEVKANAAEAYASGDFLVVWVEDAQQRIAGRVVVGLTAKGRYHAPIYGACEQSLDMLQTYLDSINSDYSDERWAGLRLKVVGEDTDPIVPYLDGDYSGDYTYTGFIKLMDPHYGELAFDNTDGYVSNGGCQCECCSETYSEDDMHSTDEGMHCQSCFDENYVVLDCGSVCLLENAILVKHISTYAPQLVNQMYVYEDEAVYCEGLEEYWLQDDVTYSDEVEVYVPTHLICDYPDLFPDLFPEEADTQKEEKAA
jgi:hypothetical protein